MTKTKKLFLLFLNMIYISAFTFGGGFVIVSIMKKKFVDDYHWIEEDEMLDYIAIAQSTPGAIAVNAAILVGHKIGSYLGMFIAVLGTIIPPILILTIISFFYNAFATNYYVSLVLKGMQAGVAAVVLDVSVSLLIKESKKKNILTNIIMIAAFVLVFFLRINVIYIILTAAIVGIVYAIFEKRRGKNDLS